MISFDVESLFTNVPIEGACRVARERLTADNQLASRTSLTPEEISTLLEFVLKSTYFLYNGKFYEQTEGAAMGSPVSAVIANMYMEAFENTALNDCPPKLEPKIWKRYVDDTFIIVNKHRSKDLLDFMNRRETTIRFTAEHETNGSLAFLDTEVHRQTDGTLKTTVYRKPTHTDQYLRYDSHHPHAVKRGLIKCLYDRANRIVTQPSDLSPEQRHLQSALTLNGYPKAFIKKSRKPKKRIILEEKQFTSTIVLPYVSTIAHQLRRRLEKHNIRTVFKSDTTLRNQLVRAKDPVPTNRKDGVVYQIPCKDCNFSYIGETGRPVKERLTEHQRDVRQRNTILSAVAEHAWDQQHQPDWSGVRCIDSAQHWHTRRVKEAIRFDSMPTHSIET
nr:uncharacterized protein LOC129267566 [Lytechinus pictus]